MFGPGGLSKTGLEAMGGIAMQNENRESFVFYRSFLGAIREMEAADQLRRPISWPCSVPSANTPWRERSRP